MIPPTFKEFLTKLEKRRDVLEKHGQLERWQIHRNAPAFKKLLEPTDPDEEEEEDEVMRLTKPK